MIRTSLLLVADGATWIRYGSRYEAETRALPEFAPPEIREADASTHPLALTFAGLDRRALLAHLDALAAGEVPDGEALGRGLFEHMSVMAWPDGRGKIGGPGWDGLREDSRSYYRGAALALGPHLLRLVGRHLVGARVGGVDRLLRLAVGVDDGPGRVEVLMVRRQRGASFMADAHVFPGGRGRLRLVREETQAKRVLGGQDAQDAETTADEESEEAAEAEAQQLEDGPQAEEELGVEIEITPAGKSMKRLTLLSGGEKSMTAIAFLFSVFLAKPCPFYILDEVEAALDDLNISRFLALLQRYRDRAQFIVVTHQKRTMEAADTLYGVSMGDDGVSKVISRRLPRDEAADAPAVAAG